MITRALLIPAALFAALAFVAIDEAKASPLAPASARTAIHFGPRIYVGGRVNIPLGHAHRREHYRREHYRREVVEYVGGYYETRTREVEVPGAQIGWDMHGRPLYGERRIEVQTYQEWIPRRRVVRTVRVAHRPRSRGYVTVGGRIRLR